MERKVKGQSPNWDNREGAPDRSRGDMEKGVDFI